MIRLTSDCMQADSRQLLRLSQIVGLVAENNNAVKKISNGTLNKMDVMRMRLFSEEGIEIALASVGKIYLTLLAKRSFCYFRVFSCAGTPDRSTGAARRMLYDQ